MTEVYILSAVRTAIGIGKPEKGALYPISPVNLSAHVLKAAVEQAGIESDQVEDVVWGCVTQIGDQGANIARLAALQAGFPVSVPAVTINRMCGSSQQSIHYAAQAILAGDMDIVIAGGTEMMSHQPLGADWPASWPEDFPYPLVHQGQSAEMMAEKWQISRGELDNFSFQSHYRAMQATQNGQFESQILPIKLPDGSYFKVDQGIRMPPNMERMADLAPVFKKDGVITAGNSSQISDGAAALVLASPRAVGRLNLIPRASIRTRIVVGSDPVLMLDGPITATHTALKRSGVKLDNIDVIEINEAFASVVLAWIREFNPDPETVNPNGGAIALGHPLGATGAILMTKLLYELEHRKGQFGLQTMCIGHGMATATIVEQV